MLDLEWFVQTATFSGSVLKFAGYKNLGDPLNLEVLLWSFVIIGQIAILLWQKKCPTSYHKITATIAWIIPFSVYGTVTHEHIPSRPGFFRFNTTRQMFTSFYGVFNIGCVFVLVKEHVDKSFGVYRKTEEYWSYYYVLLCRKVCTAFLYFGVSLMFIEAFSLSTHRYSEENYQWGLTCVGLGIYYSVLTRYFLDFFVDKLQFRGERPPRSDSQVEKGKDKKSQEAKKNAVHNYDEMKTPGWDSNEKKELIDDEDDEEIEIPAWQQKFNKFSAKLRYRLLDCFCYIYLWQPLIIFTWFIIAVSGFDVVPVNEYHKHELGKLFIIAQ